MTTLKGLTTKYDRPSAATPNCHRLCCKQQHVTIHLKPFKRLSSAPASPFSSPAGAFTTRLTPARSASACYPSQSNDWSEAKAWEVAISAACGGDAEAAAALRRGLQGLHTLLPDLQPHWQEQLGTYQTILDVELLLRGIDPPPREDPTASTAAAAKRQRATGGAASPTAPTPAPAPAAAAGAGAGLPAQGQVAAAPLDPHRDVYGQAQAAAKRLHGLMAFFQRHGTQVTESCYQQTVWVVTETLMGAAQNYCGPGSVLLRTTDLEPATAAARALRRAVEAHLSAHIRLQIRLSQRLPDVALRLVELRAACTDPGLDVGKMAVSNLSLLLVAPSPNPDFTPDYRQICSI